MVDTFIADLKDAIKEAKVSPSGKGTMVALYGTFFVASHPFFSLPSMLRVHNELDLVDDLRHSMLRVFILIFSF